MFISLVRHTGGRFKNIVLSLCYISETVLAISRKFVKNIQNGLYFCTKTWTVPPGAFLRANTKIVLKKIKLVLLNIFILKNVIRIPCEKFAIVCMEILYTCQIQLFRSFLDLLIQIHHIFLSVRIFKAAKCKNFDRNSVPVLNLK